MSSTLRDSLHGSCRFLDCAWVVVAVAGCGQVDPPREDVDAATPDAPIDAPPPDAPTGRCRPDGEFQEPTIVKMVNTIDSENFARLSDDELTIFFSRSVAGSATDQDIYFASRRAIDLDFDPPKPIDVLNSGAADFAPTLTADGKTLYLSSNRAGGKSIALYIATRSGPASDFEMPRLITTLDTPDDDRGPYVIPSGEALYWDINPVGGGNRDLYYARLGTGGFLPAQKVPGVNTDDRLEATAVVSHDELTIVFGSDRPSPDASGGIDVWIGTRASRDEPFGNLRVLKEVGSAQTDVPSWISRDGCVLYLRSNRAGSEDIYRSIRSR